MGPPPIGRLVSAAGEYADSRYRRGLRRWRRRSIRALAPGLVTLNLVSLALAFLRGGAGIWFLAGAVVGGTVTGLLIVWDRPEDSVLNWGRGAEAERATEAAVAPLLEEGWRAKHDLQLRRGNIDHLLAGPAGTFLLETKYLRGRVSIENGVLVSRPLDDPENVRRWKSLPRQIDFHLDELREGRVPGVRKVERVQPVVVIWGEFGQRRHESNGVVYVHGDELRSWLRSRQVPAHRVAGR